MKSIRILFALVLVAFSFSGFSQAILQSYSSGTNGNSAMHPSCGSYDLMKHKDRNAIGYLQQSNQLMEQISLMTNKQSKHAKSNNPYVIPVVFHIVHQDSTENLGDSVIHNQLQILNECFRRQNSDTSNTRIDFLNLVGDAQIEFVLATSDPNGNPTTGITRTATNIEHFGGILPYGPGQNALISQWVNDSLFPNYYRLASSSNGGIDPWDTTRYLNIWIGDLRIFEPLFNNFEELVYFGFATPPSNHPNFPPISFLQEQGVFLHYVNLGNNNPNSFPAPYTVYNGLVNTGKTLVHEAGHYFGLRHIWGDGDCTFDDYISDTPKADAASPYDCNLTINTCTDSINGADLPNMVENYMDYSNGNCQNSFTIGQINLMRQVIDIYRPTLPLLTNLTEIEDLKGLKIYPNPTNGIINLDFENISNASIRVFNTQGQLVFDQKSINKTNYQFKLNSAPGLYFIKVNSNGKEASFKLIKE